MKKVRRQEEGNVVKALLVLAAASLFALAACGPSAVAGATNTQVTATLGDNMRIVLSRDTAPAGTVTFNAKNTGTVTHEIVVIKSDGALDSIAPDPDEQGKVSEENSVGESGDMDKGTSKTFSLTLEPGKYILICNEPGHYAAGMRVAFTVTK